MFDTLLVPLTPAIKVVPGVEVLLVKSVIEVSAPKPASAVIIPALLPILPATKRPLP